MNVNKMRCYHDRKSVCLLFYHRLWKNEMFKRVKQPKPAGYTRASKRGTNCDCGLLIKTQTEEFVKSVCVIFLRL